MDMKNFNVSASLNVFRLLANPNLCLPHATVSTFNHLPIPLNKAFAKYKNVDIKAVVLDKDNCFAYPNSNFVHKPYHVSLKCLSQVILPHLQNSQFSLHAAVTMYEQRFWAISNLFSLRNLRVAF